MEEIFKVYKETTSRPWGHRIYEISNYGRVKMNGEIIIPGTTQSGYYIVCNEYLHKIVANLFIPNPHNKPEVDHINSVRTDNRVENLRWVTHKENMNNEITKTRYGNSMKGKVPWNKGLTKYTDIRVANYGITESNTKRSKGKR